MKDERISREPEFSEMRIAHLRFDQIDQNPFRDLVNNPLTKMQVERLVSSIRSTTLWSNIEVRPHPKAPGRYQLASGHARLEAAKLAGMVSGGFTVKDYDDAQMLRIMADENVTQFGKDSFRTYKEATVAAATYIMREVLAERSGKFTQPPRQGARNDLPTIEQGGCPTKEVIASFYNGTLDVNDIRLALDAYRQTGELDAWHNTNNPKLQRREPIKPTLDAEAIRNFDKPAHVRSFIQAVQDTNTPFVEQKRVADSIVRELGEEPKTSKKGRSVHQSHRDPDDRFNSGNIRNRVVADAVNRSRTDKNKVRLERIEQMTSLEKALADFCAGLSRAVTGCTHLAKMLDVMGNVTDADITPSAANYLDKASKSITHLEAYFRQKPIRKFLHIRETK